MRILLTPVGSAGDNFPFIGLGAELARRGHEVTVATTEHFAGLVERCGMQFLATGSNAEYEAAVNDPALFDPRKGFAAVMQHVAEYNRRLFDIVTAEHARGPLTVVAHTLDFASRVISDKLPLAVVRVHLQPSVVRSTYRVPVMSGSVDYSFLPRWLKRALWSVVDRLVLDPVAAPIVNELRARLGLPSVQRIFVNQIDSPLLTLAMFPDWYAPPQPDWPPSLRQCGFPLFDDPGAGQMPDDVEAYLGAGSAPIVFTAGSAMRFGHRFFDAAVASCTRLGRRGLLLTRDRGQIPARLPPDVAHFDYVPLSAALPRCAALVHHGGIGTMAAAFAAGVPQVIVPFSHDQPDNANRVSRLGLGRRILPQRLDAGGLARALDALLESDDTKARLRATALRCASRNAIADACDQIELAASLELRSSRASGCAAEHATNLRSREAP